MKKIRYIIIGLVVLLLAEAAIIELRHLSNKKIVKYSNQMEIQDCKVEKNMDADGYAEYTMHIKIKNYGISDDEIPTIRLKIDGEERYLSEYPLDEEYKVNDPDHNKRIPPGRVVEWTYYYDDYEEAIDAGETIVFVMQNSNDLKDSTYSYKVE